MRTLNERDFKTLSPEEVFYWANIWKEDSTEYQHSITLISMIMKDACAYRDKESVK